MAPAARPAVIVTSHPLWLLRAGRNAARYVLFAAALAGAAATARYAVDPPRPAAPAPVVSQRADLAAEGFASLFARTYLTWDAAHPEAHQRALAAFVGGDMDPDAGLRPPTTGAQHVQWTEVSQARAAGPGEHVYTVAVQTDAAGLLYLTVQVVRRADGRLALAGYPAFVGAPASGPAAVAGDERDVADPALAAVVARALGNYLGDASSDLAADLTAGARVALPGLPTSLQRMEQLTWVPGGGSVRAVVLVADQRGVQYTLSYELDVVRVGTRWEVSAIQMDPDA
jgi:hypothetical protein